MNVIYNIRKKSINSTLEKYFLEIEFGTQNEKFIARILLILIVCDKAEAANIHSRVRESLVNEYGFKIRYDVGLVNLSIAEVKAKKEMDIKVAFHSRKFGYIYFETLMSSLRAREVDNIGLDLLTQFHTGGGILIKQQLDFLIIKDDNDYLLNFDQFRIAINYSFITHQLHTLFLLHHISSSKVRAKLNVGDTIYFDEKDFIEVTLMLEQAGVEFSIFNYSLGLERSIELMVTS